MAVPNLGRPFVMRTVMMSGMCRSIKTLRPPVVEHATETEVREAALQYVRKVSGYRMPSRANTDAFSEAVTAVEQATRRLLDGLAYRG